MFVQVIRGRVSDAPAVRGAIEKWLDELAPHATGWLGSTTGVTDDGTAVVIARFDSAENARRNSDRPEQGRWWAETQQLFQGEVSFDDSTAVDEFVVGDPDSAGFVQVMQGQVSDLAEARALMQRRPDDFEQLRPDILALMTLGHQEGRWTSVAYFTSESEARRRESEELPPEFAAMMQRMNELSLGETAYYDLRRVWMDSPHTLQTGTRSAGG